jgi:hypothetical protein
MEKFKHYTIMKFLGNDVHATSYDNIDGLCEHVELTNPEVDVNSLRNKVVAYEECLSGETHDRYSYVYIAIISGEIYVTIKYNALREKLFDEERKLRIALDDYVCTINCKTWTHKVIDGFSSITYEISKNDEENYPMIIVYKDRVHLLSNKGKVNGVINGKYRIFNSSTYTNK